jgi:hypothetical protein
MSVDFSGILSWIKQFENSNTSYNNPAAIQAGTFATNNGAVGTAGNGLAIFPDSQTGMNAANNLLNTPGYSGLSLEQTLNKWQTGNANTPGQYTQSLLNKSGLSGNSLLNALSNAANFSTNAAGTTASSVASSSSSSTGSFLGRALSDLAAIVLGLICITAGLMMFKPVNSIVTSTVKTAVKTATA